MNKLKSNTINGILVIIAFVFNILIFAPIEIYYTNKSELWFNIKDILAIIIPFAICIISILIFLIIFLKGKKQRIFVTIIFVLTIGLYIQGNFLNFGYNQLDGEEINWGQMICKGILNTIIWLVIIVVPIILKKIKNEESFKLISSIISIFIILIQIITLSTLVITNKEETVKGLSNNIFNLSKEKNIVVFMSDTFEGTYMNKILKEYPEYKEKLKDFIYFDNCTGVSFFTYSSMPTLLTGIECKVGNSLDENLEYCFNNTELYKILKENNYSSEIYTEEALIPPTNVEEIDNLNSFNNLRTNIKTKNQITKKMYKYVLYRYLPHFLKSNFQITSAEFNAIKSQEKLVSYKNKTYYVEDILFNRALLIEGIDTQSSKKTFKFYQLDGMHAPYNTTQELEYNQTKEYKEKEDEEKRFNEALASINLLCNYIDKLKKAGVYDQTTIMFLADHGYDNRFYTNLMVKKENSNQEFKISSAPVSLKDDLVPTILNIATDSKKYGKDFFDYKEDEKRIRQVYDYTYETNSTEYKILSNIIFATKDKAEDKEKFYVKEEQYDNQDKKLTEKYEFGEKLYVSDIKESSSINLIGFNLEKINFFTPAGYNMSENTYLIVNKLNSNKDVKLKISFRSVYNLKQKIKVKIDEKEMDVRAVPQIGNKQIEINIPKDIWNKEEQIKIHIQFPNSSLGKKHETMITSVWLDYIQITS